MLGHILQYPRLVASLFAALFAGIMAVFVGAVIHGALYPITYIASVMVSAALWAAIIDKRITNVAQSCTYMRAAILGAITTLPVIFSTSFFINNGLTAGLGGGFFVLLFFGWYLLPFGGLAGVILRWLRSRYEVDEENELYEGDDRAKLHTGDN